MVLSEARPVSTSASEASGGKDNSTLEVIRFNSGLQSDTNILITGNRRVMSLNELHKKCIGIFTSAPWLEIGGF